MNSRWLVAAIAFLSGLGILIIAVFFRVPSPAVLHGSVITSPYTAPDFQLINQKNQSFRLSDLRGQAVLLYFGYTQCPDECPRAMAIYKQVMGQLDTRGKNGQSARVNFLFVTVDPAHDTPVVMGTFLNQFDPGIIGLTGSAESLATVWQAYGIYQENDSGKVSHTDRIFLIDPQGQVRSLYDNDVLASDILADLGIIAKVG